MSAGADEMRESPSEGAIADLVVVLDEVDELRRSQRVRRRAPRAAEMLRVLPFEEPAAVDRARQLVERASVVAVVAAVLVAGDRVHDVVKVIAPHRVEAQPAFLRSLHVAGVVLVRLGD